MRPNPKPLDNLEVLVPAISDSSSAETPIHQARVLDRMRGRTGKMRLRNRAASRPHQPLELFQATQLTSSKPFDDSQKLTNLISVMAVFPPSPDPRNPDSLPSRALNHRCRPEQRTHHTNHHPRT